ncbi:hypothetical protein D9613_003324 [Agrocybe pediades]|uniref:Uncharacterized protein n=1 Tax=Agrocybe pediades TaxID=84607 RepID=A0A8H4QPU3_9AGAR|nr:hypothetical protein D9613_003324 [Agrocybe pediades]
MPPKAKRAAEESKEEASRATKVAKTTKNGDAKKESAKAALTTEEFTQKALPIHVNITHSPPTILREGEIDSEGKEEVVTETENATSATTSDVGFIGNLTLVPGSFSTGSYGWKGSKRLTVELQGGELDADGKQEKVQVMLSINATVLGSKPSKSDKPKSGKKKSEDEDEADAEVDADEVASDEAKE